MIENIVNGIAELSIESNNVVGQTFEIKTIIFDLGGVYFTNGSVLAKDIIRRTYNNIDDEKLHYVFSNKKDSPGNLIRRGLISIEEFESKTASLLNISSSQKNRIHHIWFNSYVPNYRIEEIVADLSKEYRMLIFSGNIRERIQYLNKKYDFLKLFDDHIFSFDYETNKRDINLYYELLNYIECDPSQALFIDDSANHIKRAKSVGLNGIQYSYTEKLLEDLKKYNIEIKYQNKLIKNYVEY